MTRRLPFRPPRRSDLTPARILAWADDFHAQRGRWPTRYDGRRCLPESTWAAVDQALKAGRRGLPGGSSLARLLRDRRGRRHKGALPTLTAARVLAWADAHHRRTGDWPGLKSGPVSTAPGETWAGVDTALARGRRGLPGRTTLARLLAASRGVGPPARPPLRAAAILAWADAHHARTGAWPTAAGPVATAPGETWRGVDDALRGGGRGLPGGDSLARLLARCRGARNPAAVPPLTEAQVLGWADAFHARTGAWPGKRSGPVAGVPGETWRAVDAALKAGGRGLAGGTTLAGLLAARRGVRHPARPPRLTLVTILAWADAHRARTGTWPTAATADPIPAAAGETWSAVDAALKVGRRGLRGGRSLARLLAARRQVRNPGSTPRLSERRILAWADVHRGRTGAWPTVLAGEVEGVPGETWSAVDAALRAGVRGLPGGDSLARLLARCRGARNGAARPALTLDHIRGWVESHFHRTGAWPGRDAGPIPDAPGETWLGIAQALAVGGRGLRKGTSLARVVKACRVTPRTSRP